MGRVFYLALWVVALSVWVAPCAAGVDAPADGRAEADALTRLAERLAAPDDTPAPPAPPDAPETPETPDNAPDTHTPLTGEARPLGAPPADGDRLLVSGDVPVRDGAWVLKTLTSLGLVIALVLLARWGWAKMGGAVAARGSSVVEVLSRTTVAPRNHVLLLRVGGRVLVVGDSSAGLRTLASIEDPDEVAGVLESITAARGNSITRGFSQLLSNNDRDFNGREHLAEEGGDDGEYRVDRARDSVSALLSRIRTMSQKGGTP